MPIDFSVPIEGLRVAENSLSDAAHKISAIGQSAQSQTGQAQNTDSVSWSMNVDFEAALVQADQAKVAAQANLNIISTQRELGKATLDIFA
jgi:hypothetical protein